MDIFILISPRFLILFIFFLFQFWNEKMKENICMCKNEKRLYDNDVVDKKICLILFSEDNQRFVII